MEGLIDEKDVICDIEGVPGGPKKRIKSQPTETGNFSLRFYKHQTRWHRSTVKSLFLMESIGRWPSWIHPVDRCWQIGDPPFHPWYPFGSPWNGCLYTHTPKSLQCLRLTAIPNQNARHDPCPGTDLAKPLSPLETLALTSLDQTIMVLFVFDRIPSERRFPTGLFSWALLTPTNKNTKQALFL